MIGSAEGPVVQPSPRHDMAAQTETEMTPLVQNSASQSLPWLPQVTLVQPASPASQHRSVSVPDLQSAPQERRGDILESTQENITNVDLQSDVDTIENQLLLLEESLNLSAVPPVPPKGLRNSTAESTPTRNRISEGDYDNLSEPKFEAAMQSADSSLRGKMSLSLLMEEEEPDYDEVEDDESDSNEVGSANKRESKKVVNSKQNSIYESYEDVSGLEESYTNISAV